MQKSSRRNRQQLTLQLRPARVGKQLKLFIHHQSQPGEHLREWSTLRRQPAGRGGAGPTPATRYAWATLTAGTARSHGAGAATGRGEGGGGGGGLGLSAASQSARWSEQEAAGGACSELAREGSNQSWSPGSSSAFLASGFSRVDGLVGRCWC